MPFYPSLKIKGTDTETDRKKKKRVAANLQKLQSAIKAHLFDSEQQTNHRKSVRIATWNIREFGKNNYEGRDYEAIYYIAEIISHFEIVALQEIRTDMGEFDFLAKILGPDWDYVATDVTDGAPGNGERMVFLFNQRFTHFRNIAGELTLKEGGKIRAAFGERIKLGSNMVVKLPAGSSLSGTYDARIKTRNGKKKLDADLEIPLPENSDLKIAKGSSLVIKKNTVVSSPERGKAKVTIPETVNGEEYCVRFPENSFDDSLRQFARTPYLVSFQAGWLKINLCTVHIYYGDAYDAGKLEQRRSEIEQLTKALANKAKGEFKFDDKSFLGVLGDFNIIGEGHPTMSSLESNGFVIPAQLKNIPGTNVARDKAYDQIAFWEPSRTAGYASLDVLAAGVFDYFEHVFTFDDEIVYRAENKNGLEVGTKYKTWRTYKMSDHLPMWVELRNDFSTEYLSEIETGND